MKPCLLARRRILYGAIILVGILLDQLTKLLAVKYLAPVGSVPLWKGVLHLTYVENTGAAFGMLKDHRWVFMLFSTVAILALGVYLFWGRSYFDEVKKGEARPPIPLLFGIATAMIVSGGIGNMIDRIALGYVVDFIDFALIDFAVFNGADSFVTVGSGMLLLSVVLSIVKEERAKRNGQTPGE